MNLENLESRMQRLEDIEQIKNLQVKYSYLIDSKNLEGAAELMTDDVVAEFLPLGAFKSKKALIEALKGLAESSVMMRHQVMNPYIAVNGDSATGRWYLFGPFTGKGSKGDIAHWMQGEYNNEYVKVAGEWKIKKLQFKFNFQTPYEDGWVKTPMMSS